MAQVEGAGWRVVSTLQTTRVTPDGRFEDVYEFAVETTWGGVFKVQVPIAVYHPDGLRALIEAEYTSLTAGRFLTG